MTRPLLAFLLALLAACGTAAPPPFAYTPGWPPVVDTPELAMRMAERSPILLAKYLDGITFSLDGCSHEWAAPQEVADRKAACCTGYARFWLEWAVRHGQEAYVVAVWGRPEAHAFTLFRPPEHGWYIASNSTLYVGFDLPDDLPAASRAGAALVWKRPFDHILAWDALGRPVPL